MCFFRNIIVGNLRIVQLHFFDNSGKGGVRNILKIRQTNSWKSGIWDQSLPKKHGMEILENLENGINIYQKT